LLAVILSWLCAAGGGRRYITGIDFDPGRKLQMLRGM